MAIILPKKWEKLINVLSNVIIRKCLTQNFTEYMDIIFVILIIYLDHSKTEKKVNQWQSKIQKIWNKVSNYLEWKRAEVILSNQALKEWFKLSKISKFYSKTVL